MTELAVQQGLQTIIRALSEFADADVVINDWTVLDGGVAGAPYVIIFTADTFRARQYSTSEQTWWNVPVRMVEAFTDWETTLNNFSAHRQAIIDAMNALGTARAAGQATPVTIDEIRSEGPITPYYDPYLSAEQLPEATPIYLYQDLIFATEEY